MRGDFVQRSILDRQGQGQGRPTRKDCLYTWCGVQTEKYVKKSPPTQQPQQHYKPTASLRRRCENQGQRIVFVFLAVVDTHTHAREGGRSPPCRMSRSFSIHPLQLPHTLLFFFQVAHLPCHPQPYRYINTYMHTHNSRSASDAP